MFALLECPHLFVVFYLLLTLKVTGICCLRHGSICTYLFSVLGKMEPTRSKMKGWFCSRPIRITTTAVKKLRVLTNKTRRKTTWQNRILTGRISYLCDIFRCLCQTIYMIRTLLHMRQFEDDVSLIILRFSSFSMNGFWKLKLEN